MSRLIDKLDAAIVAARDPLQAECLRAERAATLARSGRIGEARFVLRGLKVQSQRRGRDVLVAWSEYVAAMVAHHDALLPEAAAHFAQAMRLAREAGDQRLEALATAWLAVVQFNARRFADMAQSLVQAGRLDVHRDPVVQGRLSLIRADAARLAGQDAAARRHYLAVRQAAMADGDTALMLAMAYNRASGQTDRLGLLDAFGERHEDEARRVLVEAESCGNLDRGLGNEGLAAVAPMLQARLLTVLQRWGEALPLFDSVLQRQEGALAGMTPHLRLDRAWCLWHLGDRQAAQAEVQAVEPAVPAQADADDRAASHARLAALLARSGRSDDAARHRDAAEVARSEFGRFQAELARHLATVDAALGA